MTGPSSGAVALIVGSGVATIGAMWQMVGYFARKFLTQQSSNHADTLEVRDVVRDIQRQLPLLTERVGKLERHRRRHEREHATMGSPRP